MIGNLRLVLRSERPAADEHTHDRERQSDDGDDTGRSSAVKLRMLRGGLAIRLDWMTDS